MTENIIRETIRILLVDNHQSFLDGLKMLINTKKSAMQVVGTANNREEALKAADERRPNLILLDFDLGSDSGLEILPQLIEKTDAKVIMLTGVQDQRYHERALINGARGILLKNSTGQTILNVIEKVHEGEIWASSVTLSRVFEQLKNQNSGRKSEDPEQKKIDSLTPREREVIFMMITDDSSTNKEIAGRLFICESTLKNHLTTIYHKLGVKNRIDLLKYALTNEIDRS